MRPYIKITFILFSILLTIPNTAHSEEIIRLTNGEWPPYLSQELEHFGPVSRIVQEAFSLEGIKVQYGFFPWKRAYEEAKNGSWDGSVVYAWSKQRAESFYFSDGIVLETQDVFFHRKDSPFKWTSYEDLKGMVIGASLGYLYGTEFEEAENAGVFEVHRIRDDVLNFNKLLHGRINAFATTKEVGYTFLNKNFSRNQIDQITHHPRPTRNAKFHLILTKKHSKNIQLMEKFDRGLKALKNSGKWQKTLDDALSSENSKYSGHTDPITNKISLVYVTSQWPPSFYLENDKFMGIEYEITQEIAKRLNLDIEFNVYPWARSLEYFKSGKGQIGSGLGKNSFLLQYLNFLQIPTIDMKIFAITKSSSTIKIEKLGDLEGKEIVVGRGYLYGANFDHKINLNKHDVSNERQQLNMLMFDRVDVAIMHEWQYYYYARNMNLSDKLKVAYTIDNAPRYFVFSKAMDQQIYEYLYPKITRTIKDLKDEGFVDSVINKYSKKPTSQDKSTMQ